MWDEIRIKAFADEFANAIVKNYELLDADNRERLWREIKARPGEFGWSALFNFGRYFDKLDQDAKDKTIDMIGKNQDLGESFERGRNFSRGFS